MKDNHLAKFYSSPDSILRDDRILTTVSIFLQTTKDQIVEAFLLRQSVNKQEEGKTIGQGYFHYPKKEKKKSRYITEPMPALRDIQEKMLFLLKGIEQRKDVITEELQMYAKQQGHKIDSLFIRLNERGIRLDESPYEKVNVHRDENSYLDRYLTENDPYFIQIDLAKAYRSLSEEKLFFELQSLLKDQYKLLPFNNLSPFERQKATALLAHFLTYDNHLATWSPTSPFIFHKALESEDKQVLDILNSYPISNAKYTRYLDDVIVTFSHINTPTSTEIQSFTNRLHHLYEASYEQDTTEVVTKLLGVLGELQKFFTNNAIIISDDYGKRNIRYQLKHLRDLLLSLKELFLGRPERALELAIAATDGWLSDEEYIDYFKKLLASIGNIGKIITNQLHITIGILDKYKRVVDKMENNYEISVSKIENDIIKVFKKSGRSINQSKSVVRTPTSPSIRTMLWLGINNSNNITIPQKYTAEKIARYHDILTGKVPVPREFRHKEERATGIDYWKMITSIQGYKEYILEIRGADKTLTKKAKMELMRTMESVFSKSERVGIRKIEQLCADHFGVKVEDLYDLMFSSWSPEKERQYRTKKSRSYDEWDVVFVDGIPIDTRDIPWEDAESNQPRPGENIDDIPF